MDTWQRSFLDKLHAAQSRFAEQFEGALDKAVVPAFEKVTTFLRENGFTVTSPLKEPGRRSFKFELAENAYLLLIFRFSGVGEFELRCEIFVPGREPVLEKSVGRLADFDPEWARNQFEEALDRFVELLTQDSAPKTKAELVAV